MSTSLQQQRIYQRQILRLLKAGEFERRARGWRFGTKIVSDAVVDRLVAEGAAASDGKRVWLTTAGAGL